MLENPFNASRNLSTKIYPVRKVNAFPGNLHLKSGSGPGNRKPLKLWIFSFFIFFPRVISFIVAEKIRGIFTEGDFVTRIISLLSRGINVANSYFKLQIQSTFSYSPTHIKAYNPGRNVYGRDVETNRWKHRVCEGEKERERLSLRDVTRYKTDESVRKVFGKIGFLRIKRKRLIKGEGRVV